MSPLIVPRLSFVLLIVVALAMASCATPAAPGQSYALPPTQPPVTVLVVVTATPDQAAGVTVPATATATPKPPPLEPTATFTSRPPTMPPTATATQPPPTSTPTKPPTPTPTRPPATPSPSATPGPHTRTLYSDKGLLDFSTILVLGDKRDTKMAVGKLLPQGCEIVEVKGIDYHFGQLHPPAEATANHGSHGWTITRLSTNPRDLGVNVHWWYNAGSMIQLRVVYTVRESWNVDCNVPGLTQIEP